MDEKYYVVTVQVSEQQDEKIKKTTEKYLVKGINVTDVEKKIFEEFSSESRDWYIRSISDSKIIKVFD